MTCETIPDEDQTAHWIVAIRYQVLDRPNVSVESYIPKYRGAVLQTDNGREIIIIKRTANYTMPFTVESDSEGTVQCDSLRTAFDKIDKLAGGDF